MSTRAGNIPFDQPPKAVIKHNGLRSRTAKPRFATGLAKDDRQVVRVEVAVQTLAQQALSQTKLIGKDVVKTIEDMIAAIDRKLSEQINLILHNEDFQKLEGAWRGLHYLVNNTETDEMLKIRVMNISKQDLAKTLKRYKGTAWDQSPIFKRVYAEEYGQFGGEPFGCLVGDYYFDQTAPDVEMLGEQGFSGREIAVFYRMNAQSRVLEDVLVRQGVAYQVIGSTAAAGSPRSRRGRSPWRASSMLGCAGTSATSCRSAALVPGESSAP